MYHQIGWYSRDACTVCVLYRHAPTARCYVDTLFACIDHPADLGYFAAGTDTMFFPGTRGGLVDKRVYYGMPSYSIDECRNAARTQSKAFFAMRTGECHLGDGLPEGMVERPGQCKANCESLGALDRMASIPTCGSGSTVAVYRFEQWSRPQLDCICYVHCSNAPQLCHVDRCLAPNNK